MRRLTVFVLLSAAIWLMVSACAPAAAPPTPSPTQAPAAAPTKAPEAAPTSQPKAAAPTSPPATPKPAPINVKLSRVAASLSDSPLIVALERGYFAEQGLNMDTVLHTSSAAILSTLGTGEMDVAGGGWSIAHANLIQRGVPIKAVADKMSAQKGFVGYRISMRKDLYDSGQLRDIAQLKGKKIAVPGIAPISVILAPTLKQANLTLKDVELVQIAFPDMVGALANKAVDAVVLAEPILTTAVDMGLVVRGKDLADVDPSPLAGAIFFSPKFGENIEAGNRFVLAYMKGLRDYNDALVKNKGKKEIIEILAKSTGITDVPLFDKMDMIGFDPDGFVDKKAIAWTVQYWLSTGELKETLDVDKVVDNRYVENALRVLGKYAR